MKSSYEYSFHQHQLLSAAALVQQQQHEPAESALDLTSKRRFSVESETRKTTSPSSFEESPNARESPQNHHHHHHPAAAQFLLHHHRHMSDYSKLSAVTPEHAIQYQPYNFEQTSPSTTKTSALLTKNSRSPAAYENVPHVGKLESISPPPTENISKTFSSPSPHRHHHLHHHQAFQRFESTEKSETPPMLDHEDSNDVPQGNLSSSSSVASSQKSPSSSTVSNSSSAMMIVGRDGKLSRPFKAYPKDPLSLAAASSILDQTSAEKYAVFRKRMLDQIHAANGGNPVVNNPKMRRITSKSGSEETNNNEPLYIATDKCETKSIASPISSGNMKDEAYFERRKKNNAAAKKSRDRRRIKEDEIAIRAAFLERENIELKFELAAARKQLTLYGVTAGISSS